MSPSEKVRALLDELGIDHYDHENGEPLRDLSEAGAEPATSWRMGDANVCAVPNKYGTFDLWIDNCTPEQAIAATVGTSYAINFAPTLDRPHETMVGETVYDAEGNAIGWIANAHAEPDEPDTLKLHERMNAALLDYESALGIEGGNGAKTVPFVIEMHQIIEDAATVGVGTCRAVVCNQSDCVHNREYRCACTDLEIQDQECMTYRCRDIDYDEEEE